MRANYSIKVPFGDGALLVSCEISESHSVIEGYWINRVFVPPPLRDRRWGSQALDWLCCDADAEGVVLGLGISPYGRLNYTQLEAWYGRRGFTLVHYEDEHGQWTYYRRLPLPLHSVYGRMVLSPTVLTDDDQRRLADLLGREVEDVHARDATI